MGKPTTLVAGGAGFLGSHLCERLVEDGHQVICVDNFGSGSSENVSDLKTNSDFKILDHDIRDPLSINDVDYIFHLASRASPADFTHHPVKIALTNTRGTRNLLDIAVKHDATMIYTSTSEVYGDPEVIPQHEEYNGNVNIRGPRGCYDESKRFGETLTVAYHEQFDVDVRTVRVFNTYGPRMRPNDGRVVPTFVTQALRGDDLTIYGDGSQTRSFCYVDDLINGLIKVLHAEELKGDVVNIGKSKEMTINELAELILDLTDTESEVIYEPLPKDDPKRRKPDLTKAQKLLGYEPRIDERKGLEQTIEHFSDVLQTK